MRILIIEDDNDINNLLYELLRSDYEVVQTYSGTEALRLAEAEHFDLFVMDLMLPGMDGEVLIGKLRLNSDRPIVVITAKADTNSLVSVLALGADDYIAKPFNNREVVARIAVQMRKQHHSSTQTSIVQAGDLSFNETCYQVMCQDEVLSLTQKEQELLILFIKHPGRVYTKAFLYEQVWKETYYGDDNTISVHISRLRSKLSESGSQARLETVWSVGFKLTI